MKDRKWGRWLSYSLFALAMAAAIFAGVMLAHTPVEQDRQGCVKATPCDPLLDTSSRQTIFLGGAAVTVLLLILAAVIYYMSRSRENGQ